MTEQEKDREVIFRLLLRPMIQENYFERLHKISPDEFYWADTLAFSWGMTVE